MTRDMKPNVGIRLRAFRERHRWSLRTLADRCGLSINAISRIERGENSPTVSSLHRLATALAIPITDFFVEKPQQTAIFIKSGFGQRVKNDGFEVEHLGTGLTGQQMEPFLITIEPECASHSTPINHPGEEFVHCLSGEIEYLVSDQRYAMQPGDSLLLEGAQPHSWRNLTSRSAMVLVVFQAAHDNSLARQRHQTG